MNVEVHESLPSPEEYLELRSTTDLSAKSLEAARKGLPNSLYSVTIRDNGILIGMGRVIGDGACFFQIVDIAVNPDYQGRGLGKKIMQMIDDYLTHEAMEGSYVSMIADKPEFYEKLGYKKTAPESQGMYKRLK